MSKLEEVAAAVEKGKVKIVAGLTQEALDEGYSAAEILNTGMIGAMAVVGEKFKNNEIFVPEMLIAARAMKKGALQLKHLLSAPITGINCSSPLVFPARRNPGRISPKNL